MPLLLLLLSLLSLLPKAASNPLGSMRHKTQFHSFGHEMRTEPRPPAGSPGILPQTALVLRLGLRCFPTWNSGRGGGQKMLGLFAAVGLRFFAARWRAQLQSVELPCLLSRFLIMKGLSAYPRCRHPLLCMPTWHVLESAAFEPVSHSISRELTHQRTTV